MHFNKLYLPALAAIAACMSPAASYAAVSASVAAGVLSVSSDIVVAGAGDSIVLSCLDGNVKINGVDPSSGVAAGSSITSVAIAGGAGNDSINIKALNCVGNAARNVLGGDGDDVIIGSNRADVLNGGLGNDNISGGNGKDQLFGDDGNDILSGGNGNDALDGGAGDDSLLGGNGKDSLIGGLGSDSLKGGNGNDSLNGSEEVDPLIVDADALEGGNGKDLCNNGEVASKSCEKGDSKTVKVKKGKGGGKPAGKGNH
jgi:Ca2+-binding RTX toxin-like protein